ncbi:MAG: Stk1 family PASTA domain-containing Ser/Thr kinase [Clostridium sulfidigenes]|uniref:non-specific serine/threonine protein kinase n=1 Tax=Clostridium sulfidigenes TaxID=318464 RepID=A0A927W8U7_9CLOT|nr:Stk1 family PASTA domain-containing Ser/Thr kinase [Clostridium sulfidigenes]
MIGTMLGNRYELIEKIGEGGMAVVYKAKCRILNRFVAIKILKPEYSNNSEFMEKFRREALATATFSHSNIVNIYDVGSEGNINYIVMELVNGKTLKEYIRENAPLSMDSTLKISIQIAKALECAHKNKIIHRDIKPHNILINEEGVIKVTDFGIAKATSSDTITHTNKVIGSAHYFSPEQAKGKIVDNRTDIYSFGIVIYEMLTGRVPFDGESAVAVALKHIQDTIVPPKVLVPEVPDSLNNLVIKATQKEVIKRYNNVTDMLIDLMRIENNNKYIVTPSNMDNDYTTVMDATQIQNTMYASNLGKKLTNKDMDDEEEDEEDEDYEDYDGEKRKTSTWKKVLIVGGALLLTILLGVFVGTSIYNKGNSNVKKDELRVPKIIGLTADEAKDAVEKVGLTYVVLGEEASDKPAGTIIAVFPSEGTAVKKESEVRVRISTGPGEIEVPDVVKLGQSVAQDHIVTQGLKVGKITEDYSEEIEEGAVISTNPVAKTKVKKGDTVDIVISIGSRIKKTQVPDLIGLTLKEAEQVLAVVNLKLGSTTAVITDDISRDGKIFNQSEPAMTSVQENEKISVNYYQYKDPDEGKVEVPNFIGRTIEDAQATANSLGFRITVTGDRKGLIISQDVPEGNKLDKGSTINLIAQIKAPNIGGDDDEDEEP